MENKFQYPFMDENLPLEERVTDLLSRLTLEEKIRLIPTRQASVPRLGIREYYIGGEAAHGVAWIGKATVFPQTIGLASTWDTELMARIGNVIGDEYRVYYQKSGGTKGLSIWFPTVDMERDPRWGRTEEAYGEDPWLTGKMAGTLVKALQGSDPFYLRAVATLKHFFANNNEKNRARCSISIDPRNMREYYWEPFRRVIMEGGAKCVMTAYNEVNGTPMIINPIVLKTVKEQWGLGGFVVCDGADFSQTVTEHKYFKTHAETAAYALKNGVDSLTDEPELVVGSVKEALDKGLLSEQDINRALLNIFRIRFRYGQFDLSGKNPYRDISESVLCCKKHGDLAYKAAQKAIVLLKNDVNLLPFKKKVHKITVAGPVGNTLYNDWYSGTYPYGVTIVDGLRNKLPDSEVHFVEGSDIIRLKSATAGKYVEPDDTGVLYANGENEEKSYFRLMDWGWGSFTLQSMTNGRYVSCDTKLSASADRAFGWFVKEVVNLVPQGNDEYILKTWDGKIVGIAPDGSLIPVETPAAGQEEHFIAETVRRGLDEAAEAAKEADFVVVTLGNNPVINGKEEVDRPDITLPPMQEKLLQKLYKVNPNIVLLLISSYPVAINWARENIPAILHTAHGGQEMGNAVADVLFGDYNPAGRLPLTWYKSVEQLPPIMDYDIIKGKRTYMYFDKEPLYPFGFGLSYSNFSYDNLIIDGNQIQRGKPLKISFEVTNEGPFDGEEVSQLYVCFRGSRVKRPGKQLKSFQRLFLKAGGTEKVTFVLNPSELSFWDVTREMFCIEKGSCTVMIGTSSNDIKLSETLPVDGEGIPPRTLKVKTWAENFDDYEKVCLGEYKELRSCVKTMGDGSWIAFGQVDFSMGTDCMKAQVSSAGPGTTAEIRLDSPEGRQIGMLQIPNTDTLAVPDWKTEPAWATVECPVGRVTGVHDMYLVFRGEARISWLQL